MLCLLQGISCPSDLSLFGPPLTWMLCPKQWVSPFRVIWWILFLCNAFEKVRDTVFFKSCHLVLLKPEFVWARTLIVSFVEAQICLGKDINCFLVHLLFILSWFFWSGVSYICTVVFHIFVHCFSIMASTWLTGHQIWYNCQFYSPIPSLSSCEPSHFWVWFLSQLCSVLCWQPLHGGQTPGPLWWGCHLPEAEGAVGSTGPKWWCGRCHWWVCTQ